MLTKTTKITTTTMCWTNIQPKSVLSNLLHINENKGQNILPVLGPGLSSTSPDKMRSSKRKSPSEKARSLILLTTVTPSIIVLQLSVCGVFLV